MTETATETAHLYVEITTDRLNETRKILERAGLSPILTFMPPDTTPFGIFTGRNLQFIINRINQFLEQNEHPERITAQHKDVPPSAQAHLLRIATTSASWARTFNHNAPEAKRFRLSHIIGLDMEEVDSFLRKYPKMGSAHDVQVSPHCNYCRAAPARTKLAHALTSGRYQQARLPRTLSQLRDKQGHYSITGVAVAELTDSVWVQRGTGWQVYQQEDFSRTFPELGDSATEFPNPSPHFLQQLQNTLGQGDSIGLNPSVAHALGAPGKHRRYLVQDHLHDPRTEGSRRHTPGAGTNPTSWTSSASNSRPAC